MSVIHTDYLVIGAGAAAMAFVDSLIAESDVDVVMVDRRHRPGGHWNDAYPFVRLHQPSAFYGVNSRMLGHNVIDEVGPNAGSYERATAAEICDYYSRVLEEHLLPSGQVRFFGMCDYLGDLDDVPREHVFVSRLTGAATTVHVRRKVVDARYLETSVPATHTASFEVDAGARVIPVNELVELGESGSGFAVIGAGKTAMDACLWLLDNGVAPDQIRWIRPRDAWLQDRAFLQPLERVAWLVEGLARINEAVVAAETVEDVFRRLEACGQLIRVDPSVEPTMYRCATVNQDELAKLQQVENVVRQGRVLRVGTDRIDLTKGSIASDRRQVNIDCTADGLRSCPARPMFGPRRITLQQVRICQPAFNAALLAFLEASRDDDAEKNRLCPPNPYPSAAVDWIAGQFVSQRAQATWDAEPDIVAWMEHSRLNIARGTGDHLAEPMMKSAVKRYLANAAPSIAKLEQLLET